MNIITRVTIKALAKSQVSLFKDYIDQHADMFDMGRLDNLAKLPPSEIAAYIKHQFPQSPQYTHYLDDLGYDFFIEIANEASPIHAQWLTNHRDLVYYVKYELEK